jgi:hypothetical protein
MELPLALLQASNDQTTLILLSVITLVVLVSLGKRFFVALWEILLAPQASLSHHGRDNTFMFAVMVVFLGGLIGLVYLTFQQPQISSDFSRFAASTGSQIAQGNSNANYREIAGRLGGDRIDNALQTFVVGNFIWFPALWLVLWIVTGLLFFLMSKMFGSQTSASDFLGALAYPFFFYAIADALSLPAQATLLTGSLFGQSPDTAMGLPTIIAAVLGFYGFVLFCMAVVQAAEISFGQFIVCLILAGILKGGAGYYLMTQQFQPMADSFVGEVTSYDPSKPGFKMPGSGSYTPSISSSSSTAEPPAASSDSGGASVGGGAALPSLE